MTAGLNRQEDTLLLKVPELVPRLTVAEMPRQWMALLS